MARCEEVGFEAIPAEPTRCRWCYEEHGQDEDPANKRVLSFSQIELDLTCPRKYRMRYIDGVKLSASGAMVLGRAWHQGIELNYRQKTRSHEDLPAAEVVAFTVERCRDALERGIADGSVVLTDWERAPKLIDLAAEAAAVHHREIAPGVQPVLVEERWRIGLGEAFPFDLVGVFDVVDKDGVIADNKLTRKALDQEGFDRSLQWSIYSLAYRVMRGEVEGGLALHAVEKKPRVRAKVLRGRRTTAQLRWTAKLIEEVGAAILAGSFPPNPLGEFCSPKFCGYWAMCQGCK